ncbi:pectinesterase 4-like protein, partial [Trifolium pratense]
PLEGQSNVVVADGTSAYSRFRTGVVLQNCSIMPDNEFKPYLHTTKTYLARPWDRFSTAVFLENYIADFIQRDGYLIWKKDRPNIETLTLLSLASLDLVPMLQQELVGLKILAYSSIRYYDGWAVYFQQVIIAGSSCYLIVVSELNIEFDVRATCLTGSPLCRPQSLVSKCPTAPTCPVAILGGFPFCDHQWSFISTFHMRENFHNNVPYPVNLRAVVGLGGWLPA